MDDDDEEFKTSSPGRIPGHPPARVNINLNPDHHHHHHHHNQTNTNITSSSSSSLSPSSSSSSSVQIQMMTTTSPDFTTTAATTTTAITTTTANLSRYESQKRRDWNTFGQYLRNHRPPLSLARCSGAHVLEFLRYLDQFGKTKVHTQLCPFFGHPSPPAPCPCPLRQAWGSLDALVGRLRAAFDEHGGRPEANPFAARAVRLYLREVRDSQSKARGVSYQKKKRKRQPPPPPPPPPAAGSSSTQIH